MLNQVMLQNVRGRTFDIRLPNGVTCIIGANGTGKSTIVEAICYAMFGSSNLRGSVDELLGNDGTIGLSGSFPQEFLVVKKPKKTLAHIGETELFKATDVINFFVKTFGSKDIFTSIYVANQNAVSEISSIRSGLRRKLLIDLLGLTSLSKAIDDYAVTLRGLKPFDEKSYLTLKAKVDELAKQPVQDPQQLYVLRDLRNELEYVKQSQFKPSVAKAMYDELKKLEVQLVEYGGTVRTTLHTRIQALQLLSEGQSATCPVCESVIQADQVKSKLADTIKPLEQSVADTSKRYQEIQMRLTQLAHIKDKRDPEELEKMLPANFDPETALRCALDLVQARGSLNALEAERQSYLGLAPKVELADHLKAFEGAVLFKYFNRLRDVVSGYLTNYTPFKDFLLNDDFDFMVDGRGLHTFSGGERDLICTCFRIAISQIISEARFGLCPFVMFDSSFDALDEKNLLAVLELLKDSPFQKVLVTTHNEYLTSKIGLNYVRLVT